MKLLKFQGRNFRPWK